MKDQQVGHYKILEKLGSGGMGEVWLAEDTCLKRRVALKFLPAEAATEDEQARFIREAQAASALDHPNICTIYEAGDTDDDRTYIAMAYCDGEMVKEKIARGPLELGEALDIAIQIGKGLDRAHKEGIIHRDIKPANAILTKDGTVKIVDFGLAKLSGATQLTKTGTSMGTAAYMSPEQVRGEEVDHRTDIWALGVMLYEMVTGQLPFQGENETALVYAILNKAQKPVTGIRPDTPVGLEQTIDRAITKDQNERYSHIDELLVDLEKVQKNMESGILETQLEKSLPSIAVLPFEDMSPDKDQEYFCDGMAEEIISVLANIENLRVIARTSAFSFKGKHEDAREIGKKLGVDTLLEGSVRKAENRLRITAQLINASDGSHIWSDRYDRDVEDVFAIQDEISRAIVDKMKVKLLRGEKEAISKRHTGDPEVYNLYLLGRHHIYKFTEEDTEKSKEYFERALELDPEYAPAYTGVGMLYLVLGGSGLTALPSGEAIPKAREALKRAIDCNPEFVEAHGHLGFLYLAYDWNWSEAKNHIERALALDPYNAEAHRNYAHYLTMQSRPEEAVREITTAMKLDPLVPLIYQNAAKHYYMARQYDKAIEQGERALKLDPNFKAANWDIGMAYLQKGMFEKAVEVFKSVTSLE